MNFLTIYISTFYSITTWWSLSNERGCDLKTMKICIIIYAYQEVNITQLECFS